LPAAPLTPPTALATILPMPRVRSSLILVGSCLAMFAAAAEFAGKVVGVSDGDTITVLKVDGTGKSTVKVRLAGIDTPESSQDHGAKAKQAISAKVFGKTVRVVYTEHDRYGRTVGDVYAGEEWINLQMVAEGWAWHYTHFSDDKRLAQAEEEARRARIGLWTDPNEPVPPWEHRQAGKKRVTRPATPEGAPLHWLNTSNGTRHNRNCKHFQNTKRGRLCGPNEGRPCGVCGG